MGALPQKQPKQSSDHLELVPTELDSVGADRETAAQMEPMSFQEVQKLKMGSWSSVNKELWLVLTVLAIAAVTNLIGSGYRTILGFYILPTLFSAYWFGRTHATLTALVSVCLVIIMAQYNPSWFVNADGITGANRWLELIGWGGLLIISSYTVGTLRDRYTQRMAELRETYYGLLLILRQFIANDKYTENHCYRVSHYAVKVAEYLKLSPERIEDIRAAALLHDIGKLDISRTLLYKAAQLTEDEARIMRRHSEKAGNLIDPVGRPLRRIIPIILAHHSQYAVGALSQEAATDIPLEARVVAVADVYDALTSDRPYRKAISPLEARDMIVRGAGRDFDPVVVDSFSRAFRNGDMEVPNLVL